MGVIRSCEPVKLICGFIFKENDILNKAKAALKMRFGEIDFESQGLRFNLTDYYEEEFGASLTRKFVGFKKLIQPNKLAEIKITTNQLEAGFSKRGSRLINIDPGYVDLSKLVLASTKDFKHRIYLDKGIFAEIALFYQNKTFQPWEWTYPDYRTSGYIGIFNQLRGIYAGQIKRK